MVGSHPRIAKFNSEELNFNASICCSKNLQVFPVPQFIDQLVVICVWHTDHRGAAFRDIFVVSAYCPGPFLFFCHGTHNCTNHGNSYRWMNRRIFTMRQIYRVTQQFLLWKAMENPTYEYLSSICFVFCCQWIEASWSSEEWYIAVSSCPSKMPVVLMNSILGYLLPHPEW
jgi:hypothetical protein